MTDLGVIINNSTLFLELLTKDELGNPIRSDIEPTATITRHDGLSVIVVANVKLNEMSNIGEYTYSFDFPEDWSEGEYIITYEARINETPVSLQEKFTLIHAETTEEFILNDDEEVEFGDESTFLFGAAYQTESELIVTETGVTIKPMNPLKYNHTYTLVLTKHIQNENKEKSLGRTKHITFSSEYSPLYATPLEVRFLISEFFDYFTLDEVYSALRDAGEKAHVYKDLVPDANNSRFKMAQERDDYYFALTKYQVHEAARALLTRLLMKLLQGGGDGKDRNGFANGSSASFTLGDFTVDGKQSGGDAASMLQSNKTLLESTIKRLEEDLKFWLDSMMGHNRRGFAKPQTSTFRSASGSPESRDF